VGSGRELVARGVGPLYLSVRGKNTDRTYRTNGTYMGAQMTYRSHRSYPCFFARATSPYRNFAVYVVALPDRHTTPC